MTKEGKNLSLILLNHKCRAIRSYNQNHQGISIVETRARNADASRGAYKFPIQEGRLLSMVYIINSYCVEFKQGTNNINVEKTAMKQWEICVSC